MQQLLVADDGNTAYVMPLTKFGRLRRRALKSQKQKRPTWRSRAKMGIRRWVDEEHTARQVIDAELVVMLGRLCSAISVTRWVVEVHTYY